MKTSLDGKLWIRERESLRLKAYPDSGGVWTIGYGHTAGVTEGMTITPAQANAFLDQDLVKCERAVDEHVRVPLKQCEFDALVSFAFNCGPGALDPAECTAIRMLNAGSRRGFARNLARWNKVKGQYNEGLAMRRADEVYQFAGGAF
jgi:lysozyme